MLPFNVDTNKFKSSSKMAEQQKKENKKKQTSCSQQSLANQLVVGSMPTNPNGGTIQHQPTRQ